jgi:hypothetical protein
MLFTRFVRLTSFVLSGALLSPPLLAAGLELSVEVPQLEVAEYHRPYVAAWIERDDRSVAANLLVWYQQKKGGAPAGPMPGGNAPANTEGGTKWLPDLRQWWRRTGRELTMPVDDLSGATRAVGQHRLSFTEGKAPLNSLAPGKYKLQVEAAREEGGRELVDIPFEWPAAAATELKVQGKSELGAVTLNLKP